MDPRDVPEQFADGVDCAACGRSVGRESVRVLAVREDLAFVEVDCPGCGCEGLAIILGEMGDGPASRSPSDAPPVGIDDVIAMRAFLAGYRGTLSELAGGTGDSRPGTTGRS
jgi:hypothetical protein